jgi:hypothetical protein
MTDRPAPSVCQLLADLHTYRVQTMAKEDLQVNIDQRQLLEDTADRAGFVTAGDVVEPFTLPEVHGGTAELDGLLANGPAVVVVGQDRVVRFADVHPDWLVRTEAGAVLEAVRPLVAVPA